MAEFGFTGGTYIAASITQADQECINFYVETDPNKKDDNPETPDERGVTALYPCPGTVTLLEQAAAEWRCLLVLPGGATMLGVRSNILYSINSAYSATAVGTLNTYAGIVGIANNDTSAYLCDGPYRYYYTWATNTFAQVTDGAFDGGTSVDIIDNFLIYNRPGTNQWGCTDAGDVISNALNLGSLVGSSGNIVAVIADHRQVLVLGEQYSERHSNIGTSPFPFAVLAGSSIQHGCAAKYSIARLGEAIAFLAQDTRGRVTVIMWGAALSQPQRISTFAVEQALQKYAITSDAIGYTYSQSGHEFYMLTFPTEDVTWCYDIASSLWHKRAWRDPLNVYHRHRSNCCAIFGDDTVVGDFENGKLYNLTLEEFTDDGQPLPCVRRCRHITSDLKRQFFSDLQIQFQPGVGLQSGQGDDPECILRWSKDGGFTWGNDHFLKLGKVGQYTRRAMKRRMGYARDMVIEVTATDPVYRVVVSANMNATAGAN